MKYLADDGKIFETEQECKNYEALQMEGPNKIIAFDGNYDIGTGEVDIGEMVNFNEIKNRSLADVFDEYSIIYVPESRLDELYGMGYIATEGLTAGLNLYDYSSNEWYNAEVILEKLKKDMRTLQGALDKINSRKKV